MLFKVLVVDDDEAICRVIDGALASLDCEVETALTGNQALERLDSQAFEVLVLDLSLPDMDGIELLRYTRLRRPTTEVVVLTAHASLETAIEAVRLGAYDYITKPAPIEIIRATVRRALEKQQLTTRLSTLLSLSGRMSSHPGLEQIAESVLLAIGQVMRFGLCGLWLVDKDRNELYRLAACESAPPESMRLPLDGERGIVVAAVRAGKPIYVPDVRQDHRYVPSRPESRSELAVPLKVQNQVIGVLNIEREEVDGFHADDVRLISALADQVSVTIENAFLHDEFVQEQERLRTVLQNMPVLLVAMDEKGRIVVWNRECERVTGYTAEEIVGNLATVRRLFPNRDYRRRLFREWRERGNDFLDWEIDFTARDGSVKTISWSSIADRFPVPGWHTWAVGVDVTERKRLMEDVRRWTYQLEALRKVGLQITSQLERDELLHSIVSYAVELLDGTAGGLYLHRPEQDALEWVVAVGEDLPPIGSILQAGEGLSGKVWETGQAMKVDDYREWEGKAEQHRHLPWVAVVGAPVHWRGDFLGVIVVTSSVESRPFLEADLELLSLFAVQSAIALKNATLHEETRRRALELYALNQAIRSLTANLDLDAVLKTVLTEARSAVKAEATSVLLYKEDEKQLRFVAAVGPGEERLVGVDMPSDQGIAGWVAQSREPALVSNVREDSRFYDRIDDITGCVTRNLIAVPLVHKGRLIGVLEAVNRVGGEFTGADRHLLVTLADSAAIAIDNANLHSEVQRRLAEVQVLHEVTVAASSTLDFDQVLKRTIEAIQRTLGVEYLAFALPDSSGEHMTVHQARIGFARPSEACLLLPLQDSICGRVYTSGKPELIEDTQGLTHYFRDTEGLRSLLAVPVRLREQVSATLNVGSTRPRAFGPDDVRLFEAIAAQLGIVMENAHLYEAEREQRKLVEQSRVQLIQSEKLAATGRMAASLAHEINNPLQAIHNSLQLVLSFDLSPEEQREYLQIASEEIERLVGLVTRMLKFARRPQEIMKTVQINSVVEQVLGLAHKYLQHHHIVLRRELATGLPPILGNPDELEQVFLNIVLNGVDAMPEGGVLQVTSFLADDGRVAVSISDTGCGIPPENLSRVFEMFFSTKKDGTGLGLAISHNIVKRHNGEITVQSEVGKGTTFTVWLPVADRV